MNIEIRKTDTRRIQREFVRLPWRMYSGVPGWAPPLLSQERRLYNPRRNFYLEHCDSAFFVAYNELNAPVGRIGVYIDPELNQLKKQNTGYWWAFECENNPETAAALFDTAASWFRVRGAGLMAGPVSPGDDGEGGMLVSGFDRRNPLGFVYNPLYYASLCRSYGMSSSVSRCCLSFDPSKPIPAAAKDLAAMTKGASTGGFTVRMMSRARMEKSFRSLKELYQAEFAETTLTESEFEYIYQRLFGLADRAHVFQFEKNDKPAGLALVLTDIYQFTHELRKFLPQLSALPLRLRILFWRIAQPLYIAFRRFFGKKPFDNGIVYFTNSLPGQSAALITSLHKIDNPAFRSLTIPLDLAPGADTGTVLSRLPDNAAAFYEIWEKKL